MSFYERVKCMKIIFSYLTGFSDFLLLVVSRHLQQSVNMKVAPLFLVLLVMTTIITDCFPNGEIVAKVMSYFR